jgi:hypothetical protein
MVDLATGALDPWNPLPNGQTSGLALSGNTLYLGGSFTMLGTTVRNRIAAVDALSGALLPWDPNANNAVGPLAVSGGTVYAIGSFSTIGGQARNGIAAIDADTASVLPWNPSPDIAPTTLEVSGGTVYVGGVFGTMGGASRSKLAALNTTTGAATSWNPNLTGVNVLDLELLGGNVIAAGEFWTVGGVEHRNLAAIVDPALLVAVPERPSPGPGLALAPLTPNPSIGRVRVTFDLVRASHVELSVFDVSGRHAGTMLDAWRPAGPQSIDWDAGSLPPGVYLARLATESGAVTRRFVRTGPIR